MIALSLCVASGALVAAETAAPAGAVASAGIVSIPPGVSGTQVKDIIITSLTAREWKVKEQTDGRVVGYLNHRGVEATLTLTYDANQITMACEGWKVDKAGKRIAPEQPTRWINNMHSDLVRRLARR